jgi:hypothetical protein
LSKNAIKDLEAKEMMHENVIQSRNFEVQRLNKELNTLKATTSVLSEKCENEHKKERDRWSELNVQSDNLASLISTFNGSLNPIRQVQLKCEECEFEVNNEHDLKMHVKANHMVECENCNEKFAGINKLNSHMCRIHVINPSFGDYYMKNWFVKNECIRVFSEQKQKEISILHSELCIKNHPCSCLPSNFRSKSSFTDENKLVHMPASLFILDSEVNWPDLSATMNN